METNTAKIIAKYNNTNRKIILGPRTFNFKNKKVALCLGSGGMRGSYQAGVIKALEEKGIKADIVVGTSIGSLNGAAYVQGYTADKLIDLWTNIKQEDIYTCEWTTNEKLNQVLEKMMNKAGSGDLLLIGASLLSGSVDNSAYCNFVPNVIDKDKVLNSNIQYGLGTIKVSGLKYTELTKEQMGNDLCDYIICSSSAYPVFPAHELNGEKYIDGGYSDGLAIDFCRKLGAEHIIAVDIGTSATHKDEMKSKDVTYLLGNNLGSFLNFEQEQIQANLKLGYNDAMKAFEHYKP